MSTSTMAQEIRASPEGERTRLVTTACLAGTVGVDLIAGFVAWQLVRPGESLLWPTALVALIMVLAATGWLLAVKSMGGWRGHRTLALSVAALCLLPILWSSFGVLPASVNWDATATHAISAATSGGADGCRVVATGSVGLLNAPYKICVTRDGVNFIVRFSTIDSTRGYAYVQSKPDLSWFPDQCATQLLLPHWWAFYSNSAQSVNGCPFGYSPRGGG
jgi:hypothetical protein